MLPGTNALPDAVQICRRKKRDKTGQKNI